MTDWNSFIDSLEDTELETRETDTRDIQRFPCQQCGGTGLWRARRQNYRGNDKCNACQGRGYFLTDEYTRAKAREQRKVRKMSKAADQRAQNEAHEVFAWVKDNADWNDFCASLMEQHGRAKVWSDKQVTGAKQMRDKIEYNRRRREAQQRKAKAEATPEVSLSRIHGMFSIASADLKKPLYRAEGLRIKPARQAGTLYVLDEERTELGHYGEQPMYLGKIVEGKFHAGRNANAGTRAALERIAQDPKGAAITYGRLTGRCSCCGRLLTKHASVEAGIGPICATRWGF